MTTDNLQYYIYVFTDPRYKGKYVYNIQNNDYVFNYLPVYVGMSSDNTVIFGENSRIKAHFYNRKHLKTHFYNWLNKILKSYSKKEIISLVNRVQNNLSFDSANKYEVDFIKAIGRKHLNTGTLLNMNDGGYSQEHLDQESKDKISKANTGKFIGKNNGNYGNGYKYKGKLNHFYGKKHTEETKKKMKKPKLSIRGSKHCRAREVILYDKDFNIVKEFSCIKNAIKETGCTKSSIIHKCIRKENARNGFNWRYKHE